MNNIAIINTGNNPDLSRPSEAYSWKPLRLLSFYRVFLCTVFLSTFVAANISNFLGHTNPQLFLWTALGYLVLSLLLLAACLNRWPSFETQAHSQSFIDIFAITLMMHASGGVDSGLGMLLLVSITATGALLPGRLAIMYAALASLSVLSQQLYMHLYTGPSITAYPQAGILGLLLFATALLSIMLTRRGRESAKLAEIRGIDLENLAELNEHIIQQMDSGVLVLDAQDRIRLSNNSARDLLQLSTNSADQALDQISERLNHSFKAWKLGPEATPNSFKLATSPAEIQPTFVTLGNQATLIYLEDRSFINQQLQQLKLASLGRLTASIAHEIRNPLGAISHAGQLLSESTHLDQSDLRFTEIIQQHCQRMNIIIESVLQLSRGSKVQSELVDLNSELAILMKQFLETEKQTHGTLELQLPQSQMQIYFDPNHLRQVLWNLWSNSLRHAQGEDSSLQILVNTTVGVQADSGYAYINVADNGVGINAELSEEIFEPFFTSSNKGTGLGLFLARELCEFNNASLSLQPSNTGTCFRISFKHQLA